MLAIAAYELAYQMQSSAPEVRDIIERGVADAVTFPWGSLVLFGIDKVTKYDMEAPLYVTTFAFVMNKDKYNQMSDRQKKAIDDNCNTLIDDDVDWAIYGPIDMFPFLGARQGKAAVLERMQPFKGGVMKLIDDSV